MHVCNPVFVQRHRNLLRSGTKTARTPALGDRFAPADRLLDLPRASPAGSRMPEVTRRAILMLGIQPRLGLRKNRRHARAPLGAAGQPRGGDPRAPRGWHSTWSRPRPGRIPIPTLV
jgi:hypothetical protein